MNHDAVEPRAARRRMLETPRYREHAMSLCDLTVTIPPLELPDRVETFLQDADERVQAFMNSNASLSIPSFVPSDYPRVYAALHTVRDQHLAPGNLFCEWGSGLGVVAGLAALLGFAAYGIEIRGDLVAEGEALAEDHHLPVDLVQGTFIPEQNQSVIDHVGDLAWIESGGNCGYEELGLEPEELDVIFVYPWPGEEHVVTSLFDHVAAVGAILVSYHGFEDIRVRRKTPTRARRS